jgi:uncharacterized protein YbaP (TraB family)
MMRTIAYTLLLVALSVSAQAQESLLWKVVSPDGKFTSYVLASSELPGIENYDIASGASKIMDKVNTVAFFNVPDPNEIQNIPVFMKNTDDNTLKGYYKREDRIRFELMITEKLLSSPGNYYNFKPLYLLQLLKEKDHASGVGFQQTILQDIALQQAKPTLSLVTIRQIAGVMDEMDFNTQATVLSSYINGIQTYLDSDAEKFNAYVQQSTKEYAKVINSAEQSAYIFVMINNMNELLIKKIAELSKQQSLLYIIDADLVAGEAGLLKKLTNRGFAVSPESFELKLYSSNNRPTIGQNNSNANDVISNTVPDDFPELYVLPSTSGYLDPSAIKVVNLKEKAGVEKNYKAYYDSFGDFFDIASQDTLFLEGWYDLKGTDANFKVKVPLKSEWIKTETPWSDGGAIKTFNYSNNHAKSDLFYSVGYTVYPPTFSQKNKNDFFEQFIKSTQDQISGKIIAQRIISNPSFTGREFTAVVGDSFFVRSQFLLQDNVLYQLLVGGPGDNPFEVYAEAFLNSFQTSSNLLVNWHFFEQPSFNCYLPTPPSKQNKTYTLPAGPLVVQTFLSSDYKELIDYSLIISTYPPGHKFGNKNAFFEDLVAAAEKQYIGKAYKIEKVDNSNIEGRYIEMLLMNKKTYRIFIYFDGNSVYQFVAGGDAQVLVSNNANRFIQSIHFLNSED